MGKNVCLDSPAKSLAWVVFLCQILHRVVEYPSTLVEKTKGDATAEQISQYSPVGRKCCWELLFCKVTLWGDKVQLRAFILQGYSVGGKCSWEPLFCKGALPSPPPKTFFAGARIWNLIFAISSNCWCWFLLIAAVLDNIRPNTHQSGLHF